MRALSQTHSIELTLKSIDLNAIAMSINTLTTAAAGGDFSQSARA